MALQTLKPKLKLANTQRLPAIQDQSRMTGRKLQDRRLRIWSADPHCAGCGRVTDYPRGFELDHITPLFMGGADIDENCQVLCVWYDEAGNKQGCHNAKSIEER